MKQHIGAFVKEYRQSHALSQTEFAKSAGTTQSLISAIEKNNYGRHLNMRNAEKLAKAMNMTLSKLLEKVDF